MSPAGLMVVAAIDAEFIVMSITGWGDALEWIVAAGRQSVSLITYCLVPRKAKATARVASTPAANMRLPETAASKGTDVPATTPQNDEVYVIVPSKTFLPSDFCVADPEKVHVPLVPLNVPSPAMFKVAGSVLPILVPVQVPTTSALVAELS